jgi:tripartite-type tricarboxylate transporter receptor subunit TctC
MDRRAFTLSLAYGLAVSPRIAFSQELAWPRSRVNVIVPFPAGAATDITGRVISAKLSQIWAQPVTIDNRGGGNGIPAAEAAARAKPDGYTLLLTSAMTHAVNPALYPKLPYRPIEDFEPISQFGKLSFVVLVRADSPIKTLAELTALLKAEPEKHNFGAGSLPARVASELYLQQAGVNAMGIGYKSNPQAFPDLLSGRLTFMTIDTTNGRLQIDGEKMRGLAVSLPVRDNLIPKIPSAIEAGLPGFQITTWTGFYAPKGTPKEIVAKINRDIFLACNDPQVLKQFDGLGGPPTTSSPEEFAAFTASEIDRWGKIIRKTNIKLD